MADESQTRADNHDAAAGTTSGNAMSSRRIGAILLLLMVAFLFSASLDYGFVYDDTNLIVRNTRIHSWDGVWNAFSKSMWEFDEWTAKTGFYRPITAIVQTASWMVFGDNPTGFHTVGIILHLLVMIAVYGLCTTLGWSTPGTLLTLAVVGLHPLIIQPVVWISSVSDPLSTLLILSALLLVCRPTVGPLGYLTGWLLVLTAALTLERAWLLTPVFGLYFYVASKHTTANKSRYRLPIIGGGSFLLTIGVALLLRSFVLEGSVASPAGDLSTAILSAPSAALQHLHHLIYPSELSIAYDDTLVTEPGLATVGLPLILLVAIGLGGAWITHRARQTYASVFGLMAILLLGSAAAGGAFTPGDVVQDRYVYGALVFGSIWLGGIVPADIRDTQRAQFVWLMLGVWIVSLVVLHSDNLSIWESNRTLYERAVTSAPDKPRYLLNLSNTLRREGEKDPECRLLTRAKEQTLAGKPGGDLVKIAFSLGNCHRDAQRIEAATAAFETAFAASKYRFMPAAENKIQAWLAAGRPERAFETARDLTKIVPNHGRIWHLAGIAAANIQRWDAAEFAFSRAISLNPKDANSRAMLQHVQAQKHARK